MNINSKAFAKTKMTKRERKLAKGPNAAVKRSMKEGVPNGDYMGAAPVYREYNFGNAMVPDYRWLKTENGVPFVRPGNFGSSAA